MSAEFRAIYEIDVDADDARGAAEAAWEAMKDPASFPPVLTIIDATGQKIDVDLSGRDSSDEPSFIKNREPLPADAEPEELTLGAAIRLALSILEPFAESSLYKDYQQEDGWTDADFHRAIQVLKNQVALS